MPKYIFAISAKEVQREAHAMLGRKLTASELQRLGQRLRQYLLYDQNCGYSNTIQERIALDYSIEHSQQND